MTNKERQKSLEKKHKMSGREAYCEFCNFSWHYANVDYGGCRFKGDTIVDTPCAKAFNRLARIRLL